MQQPIVCVLTLELWAGLKSTIFSHCDVGLAPASRNNFDNATWMDHGTRHFTLLDAVVLLLAPA